MTADLIVVGAGAAGLMTAISAARANPALRVRCLDGARQVGAKILVSGGARCNVTNRIVSERDFWGGSPAIVRAVLRAFPATAAVEFFEGLGVALHEEEGGKLFPNTNRARTVLDALMAECARLGIEIRCSARVTNVRVEGDAFVVTAGAGDRGGQAELRARAVALATGGRSLPKSGSDGFGYALATRLGHSVVETTPALVPLLLAEDYGRVSGVAHPVTMQLRLGGRIETRLSGPMLWTHFGVSGPVVLNMSRHWLRAELEGREPSLMVNLLNETFESAERRWLVVARERPRSSIARVLSAELPAAIAALWLDRAGIDGSTPMAQLTREARRTLMHALTGMPLAVKGSRGYTYAEVTSGGVPLTEIDPATLQSRTCPGLYLVGEILDVDGRLGGFNFQWAWSSGYVAGTAVARA